jgi:uncharacterized protein YlxW (UPF0749 family)
MVAAAEQGPRVPPHRRISKELAMLSHLISPANTTRKNKPQQAERPRDVRDILEELADVRAKKAELEKRERELLAAARVRLREQQEELEALRRQVHENGTEADGERLTSIPAEAVPLETVQVVSD